MKDGSAPTMSAPQKTKVVINELGGGIVKITSGSVEEAINALHRPFKGNKELIPKVLMSDEYKKYGIIRTKRKMGIRGIENLLKKLNNVEHADPLLFLNLQADKVAMGDEAPAVIFWKDIETGAWYHCLCGLNKETGIRYGEVKPAWKEYPTGTTIVVVPLLS
jgi:hypothetical protein